MMLLEQRRVFDVQQQMGALRAEFKTWRNESNPNTELEKHQRRSCASQGCSKRISTGWRRQKPGSEQR